MLNIPDLTKLGAAAAPDPVDDDFDLETFDVEAPFVDPGAARSERHLRLLQELAEIGMDLARVLRRQALAQAALQDVGEQAGVTEIVGGQITLSIRGDAGLVFSRIARAVRQTLALELRLEEEQTARAAGLKTAWSQRRARVIQRREDAAMAPIRARREMVKDLAEQLIEAEVDDEDAAWEMTCDIHERLDDDEAFDGYEDRPIGETLARICQDLGLSPDWTRLARKRWAAEEARSGAEGSPFVGVQNLEPPPDVRGSRRSLREPSP